MRAGKAWIRPGASPPTICCSASCQGVDMVFLPRHGRGHVHLRPPRSITGPISTRWKRAGCHRCHLGLGLRLVPRGNCPPGHFVIADQFIDRTHAREKSFFGRGFVAHVSLAHPVCPGLVKALAEAAAEEGIACTTGGTYLAMEGPQFSTLAESNLYRSWGCSVIGMTAMPEAKLAREAELPYAIVAMVTDFDCWHSSHDHVTVEQVIRVLFGNADRARALIKRVVPKLGPGRKPSPLGIEHVLDTALITAPEKRDPELFRKLDAVAGRVLRKHH